jgi:D-alanyl-lipoteichoic acid acyltransferase DltB (MBOAT superfamily)
VPVLHDVPIRSRTIAEFWSQRWNRVVSTWLRSTLFMPLARRRQPLLGLCAAFAVSVALHAYVAWAAVGGGPALWASIFFAAQVPLIVVERRIGVAGWPAPAARAWTIAWLCLLSPLFTEPVLRVFDPLFH